MTQYVKKRAWRVGQKRVPKAPNNKVNLTAKLGGAKSLGIQWGPRPETAEDEGCPGNATGRPIHALTM